MTGSRTPGKEWASLEDHRELWISNGNDNPNPEKFTEEVLDLNGVKLWDLLKVGYDGSGASLNLYVGDSPASFQFCTIHGASLPETADSFLAGLLAHIHSEIEARDEVEAEQPSSRRRLRERMRKPRTEDRAE